MTKLQAERLPLSKICRFDSCVFIRFWVNFSFFYFFWGISCHVNDSDRDGKNVINDGNEKANISITNGYLPMTMNRIKHDGRRNALFIEWASPRLLIFFRPFPWRTPAPPRSFFFITHRSIHAIALTRTDDNHCESRVKCLFFLYTLGHFRFLGAL